jgi:cytochrome P450
VGDPEREIGLAFMGGMDRATFLRLKCAVPQPVYQELASTSGGVIDHGDGNVQILNMADALTINRHRDIYGTGANGPSNGAKRPLIPLDLDGPLHTKYRKVLDPMFTARKMAPLEAEIRDLTDKLIDGFAGNSYIDAYPAFCGPLPSIVFLSVMGIPQNDREYFLDFKNEILHFDPFEDQAQRALKRQAASERCYTWFNAEIDRREAAGDRGTGVLDGLLGARVGGRPLSRQEVVDITYLLMFAGLDTVSASLSCIIAWLARNPATRREIVAEPSLWPGAVEELLRYESPVPGGGRYAQVDVEINGTTYPAGTAFRMSWSAANLDPVFFDDPLAVNVHRKAIPHVAFGSGWHRCLGSNLARLELRVALEQFHRRLPDYEIADPEQVHYWPLGVRMANKLPLAFLTSIS